MRVVAGEFGGRRLIAPEGLTTRPTTDRVREAMFNALGSSGLLEGALVADLFAGSGAIGIEALSRGAQQCVFVERDRDAVRALEENIDTLGLSERSRVDRSDALRVASGLDVDIVFADPSYDFDDWERLVGNVRAPVLVAESGRPLGEFLGWSVRRQKRYGRTWVTVLDRDPEASPSAG